MNEIKPLPDALQVLVGNQLSSITFVMDYWQLAFDGHVLTILTWLCVRRNKVVVRSGDPGFRDMLCEQIAKIVTKADFSGKILAIEFGDGTEIRAFARDEDYGPGPEALLFQSYKFKTRYVV